MAFLPAPRTQIHQDRCVLFSNFDDGFLRLLFGSISKLRKTLTVKNKGPAKKSKRAKAWVENEPTRMRDFSLDVFVGTFTGLQRKERSDT